VPATIRFPTATVPSPGFDEKCGAIQTTPAAHSQTYSGTKVRLHHSKLCPFLDRQ
ncbi:hypothetical protein BDZ89DRAFT_1072104, partial [Hymenopellis radicata]